MAENTTENPKDGDPLEEAFHAPDAESAPEAEGAEATAQSGADEQEPAEEIADAESAAQDGHRLAEERLEDLRRLQAEFQNFRNRSAKEKDGLREYVVGDVVTALLPVIDDIDAARRHGDLAEGPFASIARKLEEALTRQGLERVGEVGEAFDPHVHEAVMQQPTEEVEPDQVAMVMRSGYRIGERVLRPAQVAVAVAP
ncbi:nucleotide exchange factor GrpE [Rothia kristinae]|uniref:Protein GrpE n=1 Tax=Rothia kristinae TaxID=37923 RepID=A0A7T4MSQ8_9MICC|nr:nucleotide exchange factor GrpE [Rothia kristinae]MDN5640573.1 nucleotide exchange factor GrpE [Actinomycetes bacterium]QQC58943.1 nucleotide exchange factor GrpE [Rothia kristinae]